MSRRLIIGSTGILLFLSSFLASTMLYAGTGITGSGHDFSKTAWAKKEICLPCHAPHQTIPTTAAPLWNHTITKANYTLYGSSTLQVQPGQPSMESRLCLSCHDGTVAMDAYGGRTGSVAMTGPALRGTDLSHDHPIGIEWKHQTQGDSCSWVGCHFFMGSGTPNLTFYGPEKKKTVECPTCHEPHNRGAGDSDMLRMSNNSSKLCLQCHAM